MEEKEGVNSSGITIKGDEAPDSYRVEPRSENPSQFSGSTPAATATTVVTPAMATAAVVTSAPATAVMTPAAPVSVGLSSSEVKKKRGRPRKYGQDGSLAMALSPMPISASIPLTGNYSAWKHSAGRPMESFKKKPKLDFGSPGDRIAYSFGANFTPHVITVNAGKDVTMEIMSFAQQGSRAICVLAANGSISNVTLRQPNSSGGTLTYEGRFEILSLTGSFMPSDNGVTKSRSGGMSVSLAGPDGCVLGGGLAGMLVAAGAVQVVVGSFLPGHQLEQKPKKQRHEQTAAVTPVPANATNLTSEERNEETYGRSKSDTSLSAIFHGDNLTTVDFVHGSKISAPENNTSFSSPDSTDQSPSKCEVSC